MTETALIGIDENHCQLIYGLVVANKPMRILELGYGLGKSFDAIENGCLYNQLPYTHVLVDDWSQWSGVEQPIDPSANLELHSCTEEQFVTAYQGEDFDFIVSDADHGKSHRWFGEVCSMIRPGGIGLFHDINNPNLLRCVAEARLMQMSCHVFERSSRRDERCERGLLVVFKQ